MDLKINYYHWQTCPFSLAVMLHGNINVQGLFDIAAMKSLFQQLIIQVLQLYIANENINNQCFTPRDIIE